MKLKNYVYNRTLEIFPCDSLAQIVCLFLFSEKALQVHTAYLPTMSYTSNFISFLQTILISKSKYVKSKRERGGALM